MNRSESVLVYTVTTILAVIVFVAVVFGGDGAQGSTLSGPGTPGSNGASAPAGAVDLTQLASDGGQFVDRSDTPDGGSGEPTGDSTEGSSGEPAPRADAATRLRERFGDFREETGVDGQRYRFVRLQRGDTFNALVRRWTGSGELLDDVRALNESLEPDSIPAGTEIMLPWIDPEILLANAPGALRSGGSAESGGSPRAPLGAPLRSRAEPSRSEPSRSEPSRSGPQPAAAAGASYTVQPGDSLWRIAEKRVGPRGAAAYVDRILAANPSIPDAGRVRAGQQIILP
ncbi:MAG: LysM peptidoglycan-binding domain-containing protein [Planctomycetes bacterium]|nr:LysM peptidoglycan-binding domain-containing protein [Planctomycetota bacterium]